MRHLREAGDIVGTVIVHPEPGFEKQIAQELLGLADNPMQVEYVMWPRPGFRVPEELFDRFEQLLTTPAVEQSVPDVVAVADVTAEPEVVVKPVKRAPGRPKKNVEGQ